jgi:hypothetical protein
MRPALLPVLLLAAAACRPSSSSHQASAPAPAQPAAPAARPQSPAEKSPGPTASPALRVTPQQTECVERWLKGHGLDAYGNPQGTMYAGGTPTFDETTGRSVDRWTLVMKNRPEALSSCAVPLPP